MAAEVVENACHQFSERIGKKECIEINMIEEVAQITTNVILMCTLGETFSDQQIEFWEGGKSRSISIVTALKLTF